MFLIKEGVLWLFPTSFCSYIYFYQEKIRDFFVNRKFVRNFAFRYTNLNTKCIQTITQAQPVGPHSSKWGSVMKIRPRFRFSSLASQRIICVNN